MTNHQWQLARTPVSGWPESEDFSWVQADVEQPKAGQALTRTIYLSLDPYQWGRRRSGTEQPGDVCHGRTVSQVIESKTNEYTEGEFIFNTNGWQEYGLTGKDVSVFNYMFPRKIDPAVAPLSTAIGVLGMLGLTAYSGMFVQCNPQPGETAVISAASGGVGQIAGQIAKLKGCRVVGITSTREKCDFVKNELGFDACISHLSESFQDDLRNTCPDGIDIYFENVGGKVYEAVLPLMARHSRITLCGMISQYGNAAGQDPATIWRETGAPFFSKQDIEVHGLFVGNFVNDHQEPFLRIMADWLKDGLIHYKEDIWQGLERAPEAFAAMLKGGNFGKTLVGVSTDPTR